MSSIMPELAPLVHGADNIHSMLLSLRHTSPRLIKSPPTQPRRASVAMILRMRPAPDLVFEGHEPAGWTGDVIKRDQWGLGLGLSDFFRLPWVNHPGTIPELLFIRRAASHTPSGGQSRWSSHIAFPGGRHEQSDESALYTAYRETWEEIGVDLAEREFVQVGRLDEREITTSLGKRLLMILSPFVFVQTTPISPTPELQSSEVSSLHWIPLSSLTPPFSADHWNHISIDISSRLSPRNQLVQWALRGLVGTMEFGCVLLPDEPDFVAEGFDPEKEFEFPAEGSGSWRDEKDGTRLLRLWGLSLGMTLDLLSHLPTETPRPLVIPSSSSRPSSSRSSPDRARAYSLGPKTPTTVESSFDDHWIPTKIIADSRVLEKVARDPDSAEAKAALEALVKDDGNAVTEGVTGAGLTRQGSLGSTVAVKGLRGKRRRGVGPGLTAVFPRFSYPDVNFWIWVFGRRYRQVVRGWEASIRGPDRHAYRRTNWSGAAMATFYTAVRQALVVAIIIRGLATVSGLAGLTWWFLRYWGGAGISTKAQGSNATAALFSLRSFYTIFRTPRIPTYIDLSVYAKRPRVKMSTPIPPPSRNSPAPAYRRSELRIACVQYDVKLGRVDENRAKVESMTRSLAPGSVDLLVLPEMALSGYVFSTPTSILPYLEPHAAGPTTHLAQSLARRIGCHVIAGYPEALPSAAQPPALDPSLDKQGSSSSGRNSGDGTSDMGPKEMKALEGEGLGVGWNSAVIVGPGGDVVGNYRKTFRFEQDKNWAREGDGFRCFDLGEPLGRTAVGICMDMNPKDFVAPWDAYELANFCREKQVDTLVVPMNWLDPPVEPPNVAEPQDPQAPSESNLNYWAARLLPLHDPTPGYSSPKPDKEVEIDASGREVVFVGCNRIGEEEGSKFIGTSCVMTVSCNPSRIELVECCNISEERVLLATVT